MDDQVDTHVQPDHHKDSRPSSRTLYSNIAPVGHSGHTTAQPL